jgi:Fe-S oxidoreductase
MLDAAKSLWRRNFAVLNDAIMRGTPIIGLEPACVAAFRDELIGLFPGEERAERLSQQTRFITEFLDQRKVRVPQLAASALVQLHCHQHAVLSVEAEKHVLDGLGIDHEVLQSGCCGMAGSFGFERAKYDISMGAAERVLLPRVRAAAENKLILANGFSCREQIEQGTGRSTVHVAELLARALRQTAAADGTRPADAR